MGRRILWASLALAPATVVIDQLTSAGEVTLFVLSAASLVPLAWLIGEATEHAAEHTGPGVGGFLNASFGNAPELIIALIAVSDQLPEVVRGSLAGSVISNLALVFGIAQVLAPETPLDRRSLLTNVGLVAAGVVAFAVPAALGYTGAPDRHANVLVSIPVAVVLLALYVGYTGRNLREHRLAVRAEPAAGSWSLPAALGTLAVATVATAFVSETLVHSLDAFAKAIGVSEFFIAAVIVAIVGNAAEHGGAVVIARAGNMKLASEIAISSSAQVALFVAPLVMLLSLLFAHPLAFAFRWEELVAMAGSAVLVAIVIWDAWSKRWEGVLLLTAYVGVVTGFLAAGDR